MEKKIMESKKIYLEHEEIRLGAPTSFGLIDDPKRIVFVLSRYKFCAKMLDGKMRILELGCGDGIGLPMISKIAARVYALDIERKNIESIQSRLFNHIKNVKLINCDATKENINVKVDAAFSIDFIEHIDPTKENRLLKNIINCLSKNGVLITGTPNITASKYASFHSRMQHVNLKSMESLKKLMDQYFQNVFMFGMNDEVVHTGFAPMCQYIWSIAVTPKK